MHEIETVRVYKVLRPMRGGSQSRLVKGDDGQHYVAKLSGNPQGDRTLVNEMIGTGLLQKLGVSIPPLRILELSDDVRLATESFSFHFGRQNVPIRSGYHLGSTCPVDPSKKAIFDFIPRRLFPRIVNREDFAKAFVVDHFLGHADFRQAVFVREPGARSEAVQFRAFLIDHGMLLSGSEWQIRDLPRSGLYFDRKIYLPNMGDVCHQAAELLRDSIDEILASVIRDVPSCWLTSRDLREFARLQKQLTHKKTNITPLIDRHLSLLSLYRCSSELNERAVNVMEAKEDTPACRVTAEPELAEAY